ncbi:MAG: ADP-ribosylglycohydrolase family protein [Candidatus Wallbacteria bacterium]|nr:ADP-ribosylglycohydrolase family protein [Candidatus Wallbacteria bacterium]
MAARTDSPASPRADAAVLSRAQGCLMGQVAGDALGSLVEFRSAEEIARSHPGGVREMAVSPVWSTLPGQPTDDSELAILLARSLVVRGTYDADAAAAAYAYWYSTGPYDMGQTTRQALSAAAADPKAPARAARHAASRGSQANGSLMRCSPLGILGWRASPAQVVHWARTDSELTHPHPLCQEACATFVLAIGDAIAHGGPAERVYGVALAWCEKESRDLGLAKLMREAAGAPPSDPSHRMGWVRIAFQNAFYQLLHAPDAGEAIRRTVSLGGDTDTNAAIAGALSGAVHGISSLPASWSQAVLSCRPEAGLPDVRRPRPQRLWATDLLELASALAEAGPAGE